LHSAGFDVAGLTVQWQKKIAYPMMAPVSMLLAIPFAFLVVRARHRRCGTGRGHRHHLLGDGGSTGSYGRSRAAAAVACRMVAGHYFLFLGLYFFFKMPT